MEFENRTMRTDQDPAAPGPPRTGAPWTPAAPAGRDGEMRVNRRTYHPPEQRTPPADEPGDAPVARRRAADLSVTRIAAGGLAAATAAALGSRLGVAGTVVGAAVISVLSAVATVFYHRSMERTKRAMLEARGRRPFAGERAAREDVAKARVAVRRRWIAVGGAAAIVFVLGMGLITGIEMASGSALSGGGGTTLGRVLENQQGSAGTTTGKPGGTGSPAGGATTAGTTAPATTGASSSSTGSTSPSRSTSTSTGAPSSTSTTETTTSQGAASP